MTDKEYQDLCDAYSDLCEMPVDKISVTDRIKDKVLELWHDLHESDMSLDEYEKLREFIIDLFLENN